MHVDATDTVLASKESAHLFKKKHTNIVKGDRPVTIGEVILSMKADAKEANATIRPDKLVQADSYIRSAEKIISQSTNADKLLRFASTHSITFNGALLCSMRENSSDLPHLAQLHTINRVLAASEPNSDTAFSTKWAKYVGNCGDLFAKVDPWWNNFAETTQM